MTKMLLAMLLAFALLFFGGQALVSGASELSEQIGLTKAFVGLVVVSLGTSAPELAFGVGSAQYRPTRYANCSSRKPRFGNFASA